MTDFVTLGPLEPKYCLSLSGVFQKLGILLLDLFAKGAV
jgi:hypothetical protein